ncbi:FG-GAP repeat lipoprotein, putative [Shewanella piezotolerans WP3]|uniref:FG-GAP repeat lipoprotein, putative n=1 Tax=Shewanella piezotolerans (strain WP3 / JCM 13877) TaxID=225849 RepID=B8CIK5_SHEPW|nr:VCBS repeat-containing protein [Shewanella piezotolerans]ACJ27481.1 FG-GAP repeat lipoprotein, putative [Shewanella piezotolerans WP3]
MESVLKGLGVSLALVTAVVSPAEAKSTPKLTLTETTLNAPFNLTHPIVAADLLPSAGKELVAFGVDGLSQRWMAVYGLEEGQYKLAMKLALPQALHTFDITEYQKGKSQQLYFLSQDQLHVFNPLSDRRGAELTAIAKVDSLSFKSRPDYLSEGEFIADLNGDGEDDILIHDFNQVQLLIADNGEFKQQLLPIKPQSRLFEDGATYTQSKLYVTDINLDGLVDIVKIGEGELELYSQTEDRLFNPIAEYVSVRQPISGIDWWNKRDAYGEQLDQSELVYRKVEELKDINNDGITDLVVRYTKSSGVFDRANDYEVYLGENQKGKLVFPKVANSVVKAEGTLTGLQFIDIDSDDKVEVMVAGFDIGVSQIIGALLSGSIDQDVHLFKMDDQGRFAEESNVSKEVELNFSLSSGQSGSPVVKLADLNGDGLKDLILSDDEDTLKIYFGAAGDSLFGHNAEKHDLKLPVDGGMLQSDDLNGDGKEDILIKYGKQDDKALANQFRVFFAS